MLEGQLEVLAERGRRGYRRLASVSTGSVIGELSFFDGGGRSALVRAVAPAVLAEMSRSEFDALAAASPDLAGGCCLTSAGSWRSGCAPSRGPRPWRG